MPRTQWDDHLVAGTTVPFLAGDAKARDALADRESFLLPRVDVLGCDEPARPDEELHANEFGAGVGRRVEEDNAPR